MGLGLFDPIDWDGNGTHDIFDDMLEFLIFDACTADDDENDNEENLFFAEEYEEDDGFDEDDFGSDTEEDS